MCFTFSAMAKPSKKLKVNKLAEDPKAADPEKQTMSESLHQTSEQPLTIRCQKSTMSPWTTWMLTRLMLNRPALLSRLKKLKT